MFGTIPAHVSCVSFEQEEKAMSRISLVASCALLILVGKAVGEDAAARSAENSNLSAEDRIEATLDSQLKAPLEFIDTPLSDVISQLEEDYEIPILFDLAALDEVAIAPETEVTISISNVSLRSALELMLRGPALQDLTYIIEGEVLLITTKDVADATLQTKVYRVDDFEHFVRSKSKSKPDTNCYSPLQEVITSCVEFSSWQENGTGEGEIHLMKPGLLVVSQTRHVHRKIVELLRDLRKVKAEIDGGGSYGGGGGGGGGFSGEGR